MKDNGNDDRVIDRLRWALEGDRLPANAKDYATHLVNRLSQPVRVSVLGLPGSGKSELVNMFAGHRVLPKNAALPTTELVWGPTEAITLTSSTGIVSRIDGIDFDQVARSRAAFLKVELPIEILKRINMLEVVTDGGREDIESAVDWAVRRTDIALWCTQGFGAAERAVWRRVPDGLKDHAFLILSKADVLSAEKLLSARVTELESVVAEEFHSMFAVATLQALRAHGASGVDESMFHASGGAALRAELLRHAERGRRADLDSAHMFLARYQVPEAVAAPEAAEATEPAPSPVANAREAPAPVAAPVSKPAAPVAVETPKPVANAALFTEAVRFLKRRGEGLAGIAADLGEGNAKDLVDSCVDVVEHLTDLFAQDETGCAAADAFMDELAEASDMMILMQVEDGDGPAADAVTLLLQLRRDLEMQLAA
ncbi:hypothetical protein EF888_17240 [Silicimonas algicola]|uniref:Dynamin family protein n=1 Tax=Silicimonas algicola TaxID=1826607 RepID=A0A316G917_9RHOB|nr:hypothetical protein [Silicimonas algicola]AZQ68718.1 hypothetical protein EF888_17240 [Silicimonas algicola]PWK56210.1 hypothetical protein C8D95_105277 [Silicimonas algicola]